MGARGLAARGKRTRCVRVAARVRVAPCRPPMTARSVPAPEDGARICAALPSRLSKPQPVPPPLGPSSRRPARARGARRGAGGAPTWSSSWAWPRRPWRCARCTPDLLCRFLHSHSYSWPGRLRRHAEGAGPGRAGALSHRGAPCAPFAGGAAGAGGGPRAAAARRRLAGAWPRPRAGAAEVSDGRPQRASHRRICASPWRDGGPSAAAH